jgi:hypothetical protein
MTDHYYDHLGLLLDTEQQMLDGLRVSITSHAPPNSQQTLKSTNEKYSAWWDKIYPEHVGFTYQHNEWGFRSGPIQRTCDVCFYGCSQTYGEGIPESTRWTELVAQQHGLAFNNFGIRGISNDTILDVFWATSQHVKMHTAVFMLNGIYRPQIVLGNGQVVEYHNMTAGMNTNIPTQVDLAYYKDLLFRFPDEYFEHINAQSIIKIYQLCKLKNIRAIFSTWHQTHYNSLRRIQDQLPIILTSEISTNDIKQKTLARDNSHLGIEANADLAHLFKDLF